jgi:hypothetical protein
MAVRPAIDPLYRGDPSRFLKNSGVDPVNGSERSSMCRGQIRARANFPPNSGIQLPHLHLAHAEAFDLGLMDVTAHDGVVPFAERHAVISRGSGAAARSSATSRMTINPANDAGRASNGQLIWTTAKEANTMSSIGVFFLSPRRMLSVAWDLPSRQGSASPPMGALGAKEGLRSYIRSALGYEKGNANA